MGPVRRGHSNSCGGRFQARHLPTPKNTHTGDIRDTELAPSYLRVRGGAAGRDGEQAVQPGEEQDDGQARGAEQWRGRARGESDLFSKKEKNT